MIISPDKTTPGDKSRETKLNPTVLKQKSAMFVFAAFTAMNYGTFEKRPLANNSLLFGLD